MTDVYLTQILLLLSTLLVTPGFQAEEGKTPTLQEGTHMSKNMDGKRVEWEQHTHVASKACFVVPILNSCFFTLPKSATLCLCAVSRDNALQKRNQAAHMVMTFSWRLVILSFFLLKVTPLWKSGRASSL